MEKSELQGAHPNAVFTPLDERPEVLSDELITLEYWAKKNNCPLRQVAYAYAVKGRLAGLVKVKGVSPINFLVPENAYVLSPAEDKVIPRELDVRYAECWRKETGVSSRELEALLGEGKIEVVPYRSSPKRKRYLVKASSRVPSEEEILETLMSRKDLRTTTEVILYAMKYEHLKTSEVSEKYGISKPTVSQIACRLRNRGDLPQKGK